MLATALGGRRHTGDVRPLTWQAAVVVAPGGWGKSDLLRALGESGQPAIAVSAAAADPVGAVRRAVASARATPLLLLVDDVDAVVGTPAEQPLVAAVRDAPPGVRPVFAGRSRPQGIDAVRFGGHLLQVTVNAAQHLHREAIGAALWPDVAPEEVSSLRRLLAPTGTDVTRHGDGYGT